MRDTLGVTAHRGGLIAESQVLTVGVVSAIARPGGVELDLIARRPRSLPAVAAAARRLLPAYDEGLDLRVGWLGAGDHALWEYPSRTSSDGYEYRSVVDLPPLFDRMSMVLAWPEIGFPETVVDLPLPGRTAVERGTVSVWEAPARFTAPPPGLRHRLGEHPPDHPAIEAGRIVAGQQVLCRSDTAVVVLSRLTAVAGGVAMAVTTMADGDIDAFRYDHMGPSVAVVLGGEAVQLRPLYGESGGGDGHFESTAEFALARPAPDVLPLLITWPEAELPDAYVEVRLT
ncbi:hypothetical protein [Actinoplanes subglobosus]|uniref:Uncharacterized protein n=1 Tax=Actinoplanes subglobosus TaxID=1547892 RepID=A0ABV8IGQ0_9ACTN